jgi:tetratricopeptide (TPR) repeat protein
MTLSFTTRIGTGSILLAAVLAASSAGGQQDASHGLTTSASPLQEHYTAALHFQQAGDLSQAAEQYRAFLADTLGQLAIGYAHLGNYARAASLFDDALALKPNSPELRLEYALAALVLGDLTHAETLAKEFLRDYPRDSSASAQAHQILGRALIKFNKPQDARKELEAAVALDPTFANGYDLAVTCLALDDEKCAQQLFAEMEASFGDSAEIHMEFGRAYGDSDSQQLAVEEFRKVIAKNPRFPGAHYALASALLATGDDAAKIQAVEAELKEELISSPSDSLAYAALGKIAISQHRYTEAERYLKRAASLDPKSPDVFLYLGQMYVDINRPASAAASLRQCIRLTTDVSRNRFQVQKAHFLLGRILMQQHKDKEAHAEMEIAHALLDKTLSQDESKLAGFLENSAMAGSIDNTAGSMENSTARPADPGKAADPVAVRKLNAFEKEVTPAVADSYNNLGVIRAVDKDYVDALIYFQRAEEWNPSLDGLDYNWGRAAFAASRFRDAVGPLARYLRSHQSDSSIRSALGISQFMTQDYSGCVKTLQPLEDKISTIPQVEYVYAESLVKSGQAHSGVSRLETLEKSNPEIADVHRALGEAFESQGEMQKAIDELETAIRLLPSDPESHQELAGAYKQVSRRSDAERETQIANTLRASQTPRAQNNARSRAAKGPDQ